MFMKTLGAALVGLGLVASAAMAADDPAARPAAPAPAPAAAAAAQAVADINTQLAANPIPVRDDSAAGVIVAADGSSMVIADPSLQATNVARIGPDGKLIIGCVHSREEYEAFFLADPQPAGLEVR